MHFKAGYGTHRFRGIIEFSLVVGGTSLPGLTLVAIQIDQVPEVWLLQDWMGIMGTS